MEKEILGILYYSIREDRPSEENKLLVKDFSEIKEEFIKKIGENNREELDKVTEQLNEITELSSKESFCKGFEMAVRLFLECTYTKRDDQE